MLCSGLSTSNASLCELQIVYVFFSPTPDRDGMSVVFTHV